MADMTNISISLSKLDAAEEMSISRAALEDAERRRNGEHRRAAFPESASPQSISNEEIRKGIPVLDTYIVTSEAVHGGMGSVWRVHHRGWDVELAMKRPQPRFFAEGSDRRKAEFITECENWIDLGLHPNIVSCYYVREIGGVPTIFSEWMENGSLKDRICDRTLYVGSERGIRLRILDIAVQAARGLAYAHSRQLIHQDVKPGNLLLAQNWETKVADFGLAKAQSKLRDVQQQTAAATGDKATTPVKTPDRGADRENAGAMAAPVVTGYTIAYCPEEQAAGSVAEPWMDIYALGLTVLEMFAGSRLWERGAQAAAELETFWSGCHLTPSEEEKEILRRCLGDKTLTMAEVEEAFRKDYERVAGTEYPRPSTKAAAETADSLNNRALSFLDLGNPAEAARCWKAALSREPGNLAATYNQGLSLWRSGRIDDVELLRRCREVSDESQESMPLPHWQQEIDAERGRDETDGRQVFDRDALITGPYAVSGDGRRVFVFVQESDSWFAALQLACWEIESDGTRKCRYSVKALDRQSAGFLVLTKDEKYLLYAYRENPDDQCLYVAEAATGRLIHRLEGTDWHVRAIGLHPDGRHCYTGSFKGMVLKWDYVEGTCEGAFRGAERNEVNALCVSPDGETLYAAAGEQRLFKWKENERKLLSRTGRYSFPADDMVISPDGRTLYMAGPDCITFCDAETLSRVTVRSKGSFHKLWLSPDGNRLLTADLGGGLKLWDTQTRRCLSTFPDRSSSDWLDASDDMRTILTGHPMRRWNGVLTTRPAAWELSRARAYQEEITREAVIARYVEELESAAADILAGVRRTASREEAARGAAARTTASALLKKAELEFEPNLFLPQRRKLSLLCRGREVESAVEIASESIQGDKYKQWATFRKRNTREVIITPPLQKREKALMLWDDSLSVAGTFRFAEGKTSGDVYFCCSEDGRWAAAAAEGAVYLLDLDVVGPAGFAGPAGDVPAVDVPVVDVPAVDVPAGDVPPVDVPALGTATGNGSLLAAEHGASAENGIREIRDIPFTGKSNYRTVRMAFRPDGQQLAISTAQGFMGLWDVKSGERIREFEGSRRVGANYLFWDWTGTQVITTDLLGYLRIYDAETGRELQKIEHQPNSRSDITAACMDSSENRLFIYQDDRLSIWKQDPIYPEKWKRRYRRGWTHTGFMCVSDDGRLLATREWQGVALWDMSEEEPEQLLMIPIPDTAVRTVAISADKCLLCVLGSEKIRLFSLNWRM